MSKEPAFLFYPNDWLGGTMYLTFEQKGAYLEILLMQVSIGRFTEEQVKQVLNTSYSSVWKILKPKFLTDGTFFWNEKMDRVLESRRTFTESRRNNRLGKVKIKTSEKLVKKTRKTLVKLVGNGNGNTNGIGNLGKSENPLFELPEKKHELQILVETLPNVLKLKSQLSFLDSVDLEKKHGMDLVKDVLLAMDNYKPLVKNNLSVYLTCNNWCNRRKKEKKPKSAQEAWGS